jgi:hypothetical protein
MIILQIISFMFCVIMSYHTLLYYKRGEFNWISFFIWESVWVMIMFAVLFPRFLYPIVDAFQLTRAMDLMLILGFLFMIGITFHNFRSTVKNEKMIEKLVRENAIKKVKKK